MGNNQEVSQEQLTKLKQQMIDNAEAIVADKLEGLTGRLELFNTRLMSLEEEERKDFTIDIASMHGAVASLKESITILNDMVASNTGDIGALQSQWDDIDVYIGNYNLEDFNL